jgi:beta-galactosidase
MKAKDYFPYGAVLKIERSFTMLHIKKNLAMMKSAGMDTVVIWPAVYWWEDKDIPGYPFNTGRSILAIAEELDMKVIMELAGQITCLEYAPDYVMKEEYYPIEEDGHIIKKDFSFGPLNYNHPEVKSLVEKNFRDAAKAYKDYKALYGYDIFNETALRSYDIFTLRVFRDWLKNKYGTIEKLNAVWERTFYYWSQIEFCFWRWSSLMVMVDYHQFQKENMGMILEEWRSYIKAVDPNHVVIVDNIGASVVNDWSYTRPQDDWNVAQHTDEYGISFYPKNAAKAGENHMGRWATLIGAHSASPSGRFWISELQSHHQTLFSPGTYVYPYELRWWNWEAISHGAKGLIYWKWDPFISGHQLFGRGLVSPDGRETPRLTEAKKIAEVLKNYEKDFAAYMPEQAKVAILYDKDNHDFVKALTKTTHHNADSATYTNSIEGLYHCLWENNIAVKFITPEDLGCEKVNCYKAIFATNQLHVTKEIADNILIYTMRGGTLIADGMFGILNEEGIMYNHLPGGPLNRALGVRFDDIQINALDIVVTGWGAESLQMQAFQYGHQLEVVGSNVEVLGNFGNKTPAITYSKAGNGGIVLISTAIWQGYTHGITEGKVEFIKLLNEKFNLSTHEISNNQIKYAVLKGDDGLLLFLFNYGIEDINTEIKLNLSGKAASMTVNAYTGEEQNFIRNEEGICLEAFVRGNDVSICKISF